MPRPRSAVTTGTLDLLGILAAASQALSSETSLERLHARVVDVLGALTGATAVHLLLWDQERQDWLLPTPAGSAPVGAGPETAVPLSVLRYVQRTGEPLVVADATADDRFARDPHLADADCCSMLVLPILSRGTLRAVLLLENRLLKTAFNADRLYAVRLVAGQLAVSVDNAQLYAELTTSRARIVNAADQTRRRSERDLHEGVQNNWSPSPSVLVPHEHQRLGMQASFSPNWPTSPPKPQPCSTSYANSPLQAADLGK
jgi:GAF domain-containing protein